MELKKYIILLGLILTCCVTQSANNTSNTPKEFSSNITNTIIISRDCEANTMTTISGSNTIVIIEGDLTLAKDQNVTVSNGATLIVNNKLNITNKGAIIVEGGGLVMVKETVCQENGHAALDNTSFFVSSGAVIKNGNFELPDPDAGYTYIKDNKTYSDTEVLRAIMDEFTKRIENSGLDVSIPEWIPTVLPIELTYFVANCSRGNVEFTWQTASELNNDYFTIEYSLDAMEFEALATIAGAGTTTEEQNYQYTDFSAPESGTVYYRLKQTDYDGNYTYSDMVAVVFDKKQVIENPVNFVVYPNPASDYVTISGGEYQSVKFLSADGRVLKVEDAQNTHSVANMPNGVIYLVISTENGEVSKTLVKK